ncbi:transporter substrate-binding domain-containing protein [Streptosporangium sp. NPDC051022]|uniref:transporter substrate-binding domain-containing protein n=1 Tax=Streptosporangium sp. NPDC051022 TaxID=3155752 RepID=UPI00342A8BE2
MTKTTRVADRSTAGALVTCALTVVLAATGCSGSASGGSGASGGSDERQAQASPSTAFDQSLHDQLPDRIKQSKQIVFGALWETPPIIGIDPKDTSKPVGITPDLAVALGDVLGVKPVWKNLQWPAQLPGLQSGNVDALFGQVGGGEDREKVVDLVGFYQSPMAILVKGGNPRGLESFANACGMKIGVPSGSTQEATVKGNSDKLCVSQGKAPITAVGYPGAQGAIVAIKSGALDGWMDSATSIRAIAKQSGNTFDGVTLPTEQTDPYMGQDNVSIAMSKAQPGLSNALAGALASLSRSGAYQQIMQKWDAADAVLTVEEIKVNPVTGLPAGQGASSPSGS